MNEQNLCSIYRARI